MKVGDIIFDKIDKRFGIIIQKEWETSIGTPFDWLVMWFDDASLFGVDTMHAEVISELGT